MARRTLLVAGAALALLTVPVTAHAAGSTADATFTARSGFYLTTDGTDAGVKTIAGHVKFSQAAASAPITATGHLTGLRARTTYVTVPYKDAECLPLAGVTAFPSGPFTSDANGTADFSVTVNPTALVPVGAFDVSQTASVSVRQVVVSSLNLGGLVGTPTVPNVAMPEACDRSPVVTS
jgi:hypothetical protein